jgi:hypothetical protein
MSGLLCRVYGWKKLYLQQQTNKKYPNKQTNKNSVSNSFFRTPTDFFSSFFVYLSKNF